MFRNLDYLRVWRMGCINVNRSDEPVDQCYVVIEQIDLYSRRCVASSQAAIAHKNNHWTTQFACREG